MYLVFWVTIQGVMDVQRQMIKRHDDKIGTVELHAFFHRFKYMSYYNTT